MKNIALGIVVAALILVGLPAQAQFHGIESKGLGFGVQIGTHHMGLSVRYWLDPQLGVEVNFLPAPSWDITGKVTKLDLNISVRALWRLRDDPWIDFYGTGGLAMTLSLIRDETGQIKSERSRLLLSAGFGAEIDNWLFLLPFPRVGSCAEYGITWSLLDLLDIRLLSGGVCLHYYI